MTQSARPTAILDDDSLLDIVQRQTIRYFWEGAHPACGLAFDRQKTGGDPANDLVAVGGSGFGIMAIIVGVDRGWIDREAAVARLNRMLEFLGSSPRYHGMFPHFINGRTGKTIPFRRKDDGADVVETTFLFQGLICAREYFLDHLPDERRMRDRISELLWEAEWNWFTRGGPQLCWHWSPKHGWAMNCPIQGWNECLLSFVLAAGSARNSIDPAVYHQGFAAGPTFRNGREFHDVQLPLGPDHGGPLFFTHYSFCGLDPRGLVDCYANYWQQNVSHTMINYRHCVLNPKRHAGYGMDCWGLTSSHGPRGYVAHAPDRDLGVITPSASLSSFPYAPEEAMRALRGFLASPRHNRVWGRFGFVDAFCEDQDWYSRTYLAINLGPIVAMIENHRARLLWNLFMNAPEVLLGLKRLGFAGPHLDRERPARVSSSPNSRVNSKRRSTLAGPPTSAST